MRTSEWIQVGFALVLAGAAWLQPLVARRPLPLRRRWLITLLALVPCVAVAVALAAARFWPATSVESFRDFLTVALFLVPYWQTGQFFQAADPVIEKRLLAFDQWLMPGIARTAGTPRTALGAGLEIGYLFCYPMVPLGLLALYAVGQRRNVPGFWLVVLIATYLCYAMTPFVPALPPRDLLTSAPARNVPGKTRLFNRWILKHGSIHAISFPSAHVASSFAMSLVLLHYTPAVGVLFLLLAIWIALGAVIGRYHYALDVLTGALTAVIVFLACLSSL
jgi:membrane-associated phospholipid phosphatase